jgi:hypothetical protein
VNEYADDTMDFEKEGTSPGASGRSAGTADEIRAVGAFREHAADPQLRIWAGRPVSNGRPYRDLLASYPGRGIAFSYGTGNGKHFNVVMTPEARWCTLDT